MRLLGTRDRKLSEFQDDSIPKYAILSHRWERDEVSYQDMVNGKWRHKKGSAKILSCCQLAASNGYSYVWIDTCCIDKTSSAELTEAINSMYQWYRSAGECYAYLCDVKSSDVSPYSHRSGISSGGPSQLAKGCTLQMIFAESRIPPSFWESVWFTRGWTLQELIAPRSLQFFDKEWSAVGIRDDIADSLSTITNIPAELLRHKTCPEDYCIAERMSWAAARNTTRVEDRVYSLLGIFDVSMPVLYGEGRRAFRRLQEEILKHSDDMTFLMFNTASGSFSSFPALGPWVDSYTKSYNVRDVKALRYHHSSGEYFLARNYYIRSAWAEKDPEPFVLTNARVIASLTLLPWTANKFLAPIMQRGFLDHSQPIGTDFQCIVLEYFNSASTRQMVRSCDDEGRSIVQLDGDTHIYPYRSVTVAELAAYRHESHAFRRRVLIFDEPFTVSCSEFVGKYLGAMFEFYHSKDEPLRQWTPSSSDVFARSTPVGGRLFVPHRVGVWELSLVLRTRRAGRWWYVCCGLNLETDPFWSITTELPNEDKLTSIDPDSVTNEDLDWILHTKECLNLAKHEEWTMFRLQKPHNVSSDVTMGFPMSDGESLPMEVELRYRRLSISITKESKDSEGTSLGNNFIYKYKIFLYGGEEPDPSVSPQPVEVTRSSQFKEVIGTRALAERLLRYVSGRVFTFVFIYCLVMLFKLDNETKELAEEVKELQNLRRYQP